MRPVIVPSHGVSDSTAQAMRTSPTFHRFIVRCEKPALLTSTSSPPKAEPGGRPPSFKLRRLSRPGGGAQLRPRRMVPADRRPEQWREKRSCSVAGGWIYVAWETGVLAGLADQGIDARRADD